jgi:multiple sugar transport system permease protein
MTGQTTRPDEAAPSPTATGAPAERPPGERRRRAGRAGLYVAAVLLSLWVLVPVYLITVTAFSPRDVVYAFPRPLIPTEVSADTMSFFVGSAGVLDSLVRSVIVAVLTLGLSTLLGAPAGYALARYVFRGKGGYRLLILSTRAFPVVILAIPLAVTFIQWGIYDSVWAVGLMHTALALPFTVLITSSIFVAVPREYEEAAQVYGCTPVRAFVKVVLSWNEVFAAVVLTVQDRTMPALVLSALTQSPLPFRFAAAWFMLAPSLIVIFVIRRYLLGLWGTR